MGEHRGWTIRVAPQRKDETWTAVVEVWPPDLSHQTHTGLVVPFTRSADDQAEILDSAMAAARSYIDAAARR